MKNGTRLILLEGLPSTGKTTNARFIHIQLERGGVNSEWVHEVAMPHPVLFFDEAGLTLDEYGKFINEYPEAAETLNNIAVFKKSTIGVHLPEIEWFYKDKIGEDAYRELSAYDVWNYPVETYKKFALEKWGYFTGKALGNDLVYIIDSAIFQFQIFTFLLNNRPYGELRDFIGRIADIIKPLCPCLIYLYRKNTDETIEFLERDRGKSYLEYLWDRDKSHPYYENKPPGAESFKQFLRDYADFAENLFGSFTGKKLSLEISDGDWVSREDEMLKFLGVNRTPNPQAAPRYGIYANEALGINLNVNGLSFTDPTGQARKLIPKSQDEFYVDWLPVVLRFEREKIIIAGSQIAERWTATGTEYVKTEAETH